ncbi:MAG TPA: T9SS type A sorting domain-containing protein, partial [Chitinophagales bacterium]|nr:T9SS type A sorting domain-containing protein [Chitinophagales bacterium]
EWSNGATVAMQTGLCEGAYTYTVTDALGNSGSNTLMVGCNDPLQVSFLATGISDCLDSTSCDGAATLFISGGVEPYSVIWSDGQSDFTLNNLCEGTYAATVTDATSDSIFITFDIACNLDTTEALRLAATVDAAIISAYPNPFSANSVINFTLPVNDDNVTLEIYSVTGQKVAELFNGSVKANEQHTATLDGGFLADGMYMYRLVTTNGVHTGNLIRVKD